MTYEVFTVLDDLRNILESTADCVVLQGQAIQVLAEAAKATEYLRPEVFVLHGYRHGLAIAHPDFEVTREVCGRRWVEVENTTVSPRLLAGMTDVHAMVR